MMALVATLKKVALKEGSATTTHTVQQQHNCFCVVVASTSFQCPAQTAGFIFESPKCSGTKVL